ncbi:MAG: Panacea domain-containing protein [Thermincolia bacterium]
MKKLINAIIFFADNQDGVYKTKLNKLLWYSDMLCFKKYNHAISGLQYIHHHHGPVPERFDWIFGTLSDIYIQLEDTDYGTKIKQLKGFDNNCFNENELIILEKVNEKFRFWYAGDLSDYSHKEKAYQETNHREFISFSFASELTLN